MISKDSVPKPSILVTGASGFIGQNFLDAIKSHFKIFALSRRPPLRPALTDHPNITWIRADICSEETLEKARRLIMDQGGLNYVLHLAGYYDFNFDTNAEYQRINVQGTENVLKLVSKMKIDRFIFVSSVAASMFPSSGNVLKEVSPLDAEFEFARTKRLGEELTQKYSAFFKTSVVRLAAVFSDWCENGPLFNFIRTWTSRKWNARMLAGKGHSAITYIHINCLTDLFLRIIKQSHDLPAFDTYIASPDSPVTQQELFTLTTRYFLGRPRQAILVPKFLAFLGVVSMDFLGKLTGSKPFERPWMVPYIDKQLNIDAFYTRQKLGWSPNIRNSIQRRLLFMIEHMKSYPYEWQKRNLRAAKAISLNPNFRIYQALEDFRERIVEEILETLLGNHGQNRFETYRNMDKELLRKDVLAVYQFLSVAVRSRDRVSALAYARQTAILRYQDNFAVDEVVGAFLATSEIIRLNLIKHPHLKGMEMELHDEISLTFQLMVDEIEGTYEIIDREMKPL